MKAIDILKLKSNLPAKLVILKI